MLKKVKIERFKSVHDAELEPGRVNLLIGGNGSGKSNVLEAIGVLAATLSRDISDTELARKGVRLTPPALMKSAFKGRLPLTLCLEAEFDGDVSYSVNLTAGDDSSHLSFFTEHATQNDTRVFGRGKNGCVVYGERLKREPESDRGLWDFTRGFREYDAHMVRQFEMLSRFAIYAPQTEFLREVRSGSAQTLPVGLHGEGVAQAVQGLISQFGKAIEALEQGSPKHSARFDQLAAAVSLTWLPGWTKSVRVGEVDSILRSRDAASSEGQIIYFLDKFMHEKRRKLSAYDSSEGTLFLLFIAVLLGHVESPKIFALDNVDSALNPKLTRELIERVVSMVKRRAEHDLDIGPDQVFMTSHNPTSLDAFDLFDPDQRVFVVFRDEKGRTKIDRLQPRADMTKEDWQRFTDGRKLSQMWIDGEITGALGLGGDAI